MTRRRAARLTIAMMTVAAMAAAASGCAREKAAPAPKEFALGASRVQVVVPEGWEALDQGKQKRFRKREFEIVLQNLGSTTPPPRDLDELVDWGLAEVGHDSKRREVKSRRAVTLDGREAFDIETWHRLDHTNPHRIFFVKDNDDLLALHTSGMAFEDALAAFDAIRDSLHFVSTAR